MARYREELEREDDTHVAMRTALRSAAPAILASGGTVVAALLTLLLARVGGTQAIGPLGAAGVALAMTFSLTALPAALLIAGRRAFWPSIPRAGAGEQRAQRGLFARLAELIPRRPRALWVGSTLALVLLALGLTGLDTTLTQQQQFTDDVEAVRGQELLASGFPAGASAPASVFVPAGADVDAVRGGLEDAPQVASIGAGREGPPGTLVTVVLDGDPYAPGTVDQIPALRTAVGEDALVGGPTAQEYDLRAAANRDNLVVPPAALAVVLLILVALLRSIAAPLLLLATVVASNAAALGLGVLLSEHVYGFPAIDPTLPLLGFIFLAALGIDYNIFLAARAREEAERHGPRKGMLAALTVTGAVITAAGIVLAATFATLAVLPLVVLAQLGTVVALGVLIDTLLVRSVLVPALAYDLDGRFWWPSAARSRDRSTRTATPARLVWALRECGGSVAHVHRRRRLAVADPAEVDRLTAGVVVQPDALAEQDRRDVQVDLVDQSQLEELATDRRREHFEVLAAGRFQPDPDGLGRVAVQERDAVGGRRVLGVMREHEDRPVPGVAVRPGVVRGGVPAVATAQHRAGGGDVLVFQARTGRGCARPIHLVIRPRHEAVE